MTVDKHYCAVPRRYGPRSMKVYKENLCVLFDRLATILKPDCLFIWSTAMPISKTVRGGVLVPEIELVFL